MTNNLSSTFQEVTNSEPLPFHKIFESQPGLLLILSPDLIIQAATDAYLRETLTVREKIIGREVLDVFPGHADIPEASSSSTLKASVQQVLSSGKAHKIDLFRYDIPNPDKPGCFLERYWCATNTPVLSPQGAISYIIHELVNLTGQVQEGLQLKESRQREQAALAQAEQQRLRLERLFTQAPAALAILEGPQLVYKMLNNAYKQLFPGRALLGRPLFEAFPELKEQPIATVIQNVYQTGETFEGKEILIPLARYQDQPMEDIYWNFINQALYDAQGQVNGVLILALDVTNFVQSRRQAEESAAALQALNRELEERVAQRTRELQLAQAEAERQRQRLESLFMQAPEPICILDGPDLVFELANPAYQQLYPGRQLLGKPILEALPEIAGNPIYQTFRVVYETGITHEEPEQLIPLARPGDGVLKNRYFRYIQQARRDEYGRINGVLVFALEVTEQVEARHAIEASAQQLRLITNALPVLIGYLDREEKYRFANQAYEAWFDQNPEDLLGQPVRQVIGEKAYQNVKGYIDRALAGERLDFEARMPYRENFIKHIHTSYVPDIRKGNVAGFYTMVYDITEQVEARREADRQRELLHSLFMNAPAPIVILDGPELVFQLVNPAYQQIFPGRLLLGKPLLEALPEVKGTPIANIIRQVYDTGETFVAQEMPLMLARHQEAPLEKIYWTFTYQARHNRQGAVDGVIAFAYEVTQQVKARKVIEESEQQAKAMAAELAKANEELRVANHQLKHTNADLDNFIYTASHDLKAPILNIEGLMEVLLDQLPPQSLQSPPVQSTTDLIFNSVQRFKRTIEHLTEITKLQKENNSQTSPINVATLVTEVLLDLAPAIQAAQAQVEVDVSRCHGLHFSEKNLRSIIYNLLSNAIKYRSPERVPLVRVHCCQTDEYQVLSFQDNGLGIDLSQEGKLFGMFQRLHTHVEGSGIGLYMVKKIMDNAGGKIEVESKIGEGSVFRLYFRQSA